MSVSKVNDIYYRRFILDHLENKFEIKDLYDVVVTLNPKNELFKIKSQADVINGSSHKMDMKMIYDFPTEKSAKLFSSTYANLVQKGKTMLDLQVKKNKVLIKFKEPMVITHKYKDTDIPRDRQRRISDAIAFREESHLLSDIFIKSIDTLFNSGLYKLQRHSDFQINRDLSSVESFLIYEELLNKKKNGSTTAFYTTAMFKNSINMNPKVNNEIMSEITLAMNSRVDRFNGSLLAKSIFRLVDKNGGLEYAINIKSQAKAILKNAKEISQDPVGEASLVSKFLKKLKGEPKTETLIINNDLLKKETSRYKLRYK